jgi:S1-C subfamily serine protease
MKKLIFIFLFLNIFSCVYGQLLYTKSWPNVEVGYPGRLAVREIEVFKDSTVVHMRLNNSAIYYSSAGWKKISLSKWVLAIPNMSEELLQVLAKTDLNEPNAIFKRFEKSKQKLIQKQKKVEKLRDSIERIYANDFAYRSNISFNQAYSRKQTPEKGKDITLTFKAFPEDTKTITIIELTKNGIWFNKLDVSPINAKLNYQPTHHINLSTQWNEQKLREYWAAKGIKANEGIYEDLTSGFSYKVALKYNLDSNYYELYYLNGKNLPNWIEGDLKAILQPTGSFVVYNTKYYPNNKQVESNYFAILSGGILELFNSKKEPVVIYNKTFPAVNPTELPVTGTGTGFALNSQGYIATNSHVVKSARNITVKGINGDFSKSYVAKVLLDDKTNDLAIIKITDANFKSLGNIPYRISNEVMDVGTSVFSLGYPITDLLGEEIKYTNGTISSKTGIMGDITAYQMTTSIQGGNSGGPVFNSKGEVIGISNRKIILDNVDNVFYCIKTNYLLSLVENLDPKIQLPTTNLISTKTTPEQIKALKNFVYIIEIR